MVSAKKISLILSKTPAFLVKCKQIHFEEKKQNVAIFVSKYDHCLQEILWRNSLNEFNIQIKLIISNHTNLKYLADQNNIPFFHFDIKSENKHIIEFKLYRSLTLIQLF